jgi:glycosyltransferase involved in cell wall biosynthesis
VAERLRVLIAGWVNSPHLVAWADTVTAAGHQVHLAGSIVPELSRAPVEYDLHVLSDNGIPLLRSLAMSRSLAAVAREIKPDLVHAHWLPEAGWMAAREGLHPLVCSAWGSDVLGVRGIGKLRSRRALKSAALVFADSSDLARATRELGGGRVSVEVVRWGLDLMHFSPGDQLAARSALGLPPSGRLVVSPRGLKRVYNPDLVIDTFARVRARCPDTRLLLKHPGAKMRPELTARIERLGLADAVVILGGLPFDRMVDVYRAADVIVSIPESDSSPRSVWEALACGRAVVVSDLPWVRDELGKDRYALAVPLQVDAIADAVVSVLTDEALALRLGRAARRLAIAELHPQKCANRVDALYRRVVAGVR